MSLDNKIKPNPPEEVPYEDLTCIWKVIAEYSQHKSEYKKCLECPGHPYETPIGINSYQN